MPCGFCGRVRGLFRVGPWRGKNEVVGTPARNPGDVRHPGSGFVPPPRTWPHLALGEPQEGEDYRGG